MSLDSIWVRLGGFGCYQRRAFAFLCLVGLPFSFIDTGPAFWADTPKIHCVLMDKSGTSLNNTVLDNVTNVQGNINFASNITNGTGTSTERTMLHNGTKDDEQHLINGTTFKAATSLSNITHNELGDPNMLAHFSTGQKCSISMNEGLITLRDGNTTRKYQLHDQASTIVSRVSYFNHFLDM